MTLAASLHPATYAQSTTIIENARIWTGDGTTFTGTVVVHGDKIAAVGPDAKAPMSLFSRPTHIDAKGKFVTPGLIDAWSTIGARIGASRGEAYSEAADAFDPYAEHELKDALRQGVTAAYVPARVASGIGGIGAVVRLIPGGSRDEVMLSERAALSTVFGGAEPLGRVRAAEAVRKALGDAREYREALETYDEDLKQYEKDLAEWVKKHEQEEKAGEGAKGESQPAGKKAKPGRRQRGQHGPRTGGDDKPEPQTGHGEKDGDEKGGKKGEKGKDEAPEKPTKPARSPDNDVLLQAIDGELVWRVEAYRPADLLNAIEIADEFNLALMLEGATGAHLLADKLAEREIPVVLEGLAPDVRYAGGIERDRDSSQIATLIKAGVTVLIASGPDGGQSPPNLALRAAQAVAMGMNENDALKAITSTAAEELGVADKVGRLEPGMQADLVIWSDHPLAPGAHVERVFIAGRDVFHIDEGSGQP